MFRPTVCRANLRLILIALTTVLFTTCQAVDAQRGFVSFARTTLDEDLSGAYGMDIIDMDGDGRLDVLALANEPAQLVWYRNPDWQRFVVTVDPEAKLDAAPKDIDGDGDVDIVLVGEFSIVDTASAGNIYWLENPGAVASARQWPQHRIDRLPGAQRVDWGDLNGDGEEELVVLARANADADASRFAAAARIKAYPIPPDLDVRRWPGVVLDRTLQIPRDMALLDWDDNGRHDILTASADGVHLFRLGYEGRAVAKQRLATPLREDAQPARGVREIVVGRLSGARRFMAGLESGGNELVVYTPPPPGQSLWQPTIIDAALGEAQTLLLSDLDGDGVDEILSGSRGESAPLIVYDFVQADDSWLRIEVDAGGSPVTALAVGDLDGDGWPDLVAIADGTVTLYHNQGP